MRKLVDRNIFDAIRREVVRRGYLPDVKNYVGDTTGWEKARETLRQYKGQIIDVFGTGSAEHYGAKEQNNIMVGLEDEFPGSLGGVPAYFYELVDGTEGGTDAVYKAFWYPARTRDLEYYIRTYAVDTEWDRLMWSIVARALREKAHIPLLDANGSKVGDQFMEFTGTVPQLSEHGIERTYIYLAHDVWPGEPEPVPGLQDVSVMSTVDFGLITQRTLTEEFEFQGNWNADDNEPELQHSTGTKFHYYRVSVAGTTDFGGGPHNFQVNDHIYHDGTYWRKLKV